MKTSLTPEQIEQYQRDGCLIIEGFLTQDELDAMRQAVDEAVKKFGKSRVAGAEHTAADDVDEDDYYSKVFVQKLNLWKYNDTIKGFFLNEELGKMMCDLEGIDGIRVWHDQTLQKAPWGNPTGWHLDNPYWSTHSRHAISIWIALDDATPDNGCLYYLPGTQKLATFDNANIGANMDAIFDVYPQFKDIEPVSAAMKAGSCGFHNGLTVHGAGPNMTPRWRRAMTCAYIPDGSTFNGQQNILTKEQMAKLSVGDPLNDDEHNPVIYSRKIAQSV